MSILEFLKCDMIVDGNKISNKYISDVWESLAFAILIDGGI